VKWTAEQCSCLVEALAFAAFVGWYIWRLQADEPWTSWVLLLWLVGSYFLRKDTPKTIGWRADNLWPATVQAAKFFGAGFLAIFATGACLGMLHRAAYHVIEPRRLASYLAFCLLQQVALNSLVMNRLLTAFGGKIGPAALVAGLVFSALHWPNPVLVPITLVGGAGMAWLFGKQRNIVPLAVGQMVLGSVIWWAFPLVWHHSMRVGPAYWNYR